MSAPNRFTLAVGSDVYTVAAARNALMHGMTDGKSIVYTAVPTDWLTKPPEHYVPKRRPAWPQVTWTAPVIPPPANGGESTITPAGDHVITPGTGALTVQGSAPKVESRVENNALPELKVTWTPYKTDRGYAVRGNGVVVPPSDSAKPARPKSVLPWLDSAAVFVPKSIREPFVGDLREDMTERLAAGWSPTWVKAIAISQVAVLVVRWLWSTGWFRALRGGT